MDMRNCRNIINDVLGERKQSPEKITKRGKGKMHLLNPQMHTCAYGSSSMHSMGGRQFSNRAELIRANAKDGLY